MNISHHPQIHVIGDVHLGRRFIEGVPLERRGEREEGVWNDFQNQLQYLAPGIRWVIQTGDIFDAFAVEEAVVLRCFEILKDAAKAHPRVVFIVYRGNHDASRDTNKKSSFDILKSLCESIENIEICDSPMVFSQSMSEKEWFRFGVMPWHPFTSAKELAAKLQKMVDLKGHLDIVFTHCDLKSYGGSEHNVLPIEELSKLCDLVVNGHVHKPEIINDNDHGLSIQLVGSMQPYAHGEEAEANRYLTVTLAEALALKPEDTHDKHVRVLLSPGEELPEGLDCLALTWKRVAEKVEDDDNYEEVELADFDLRNILVTQMTKNTVGNKVLTSVIEKYDESRAATE